MSALDVSNRLRRLGIEPFLSFDAVKGIPGGSAWEAEILKAIRGSAAVVLCATPEASDSRWVFAEVMIARYEGRPVIPLLIRGTDDAIWENLRATAEFIDLRTDPREGYTRLRNALRVAGLLPASSRGANKPKAPPFPGLAPYVERDASHYFGRKVEIEAVLNRLRPRLGLSRERLLVVAGPSGSGKSSLIRAGVIPRLRSGSVDGSASWLIAPTVLGGNPIATLAKCIFDLRPDGPRLAQIEARLRAAPTGLRDVVEELLRATGNPVLLIYVDSIEGLVAGDSPREEAAEAMEMLVTAAISYGAAGECIVVATLRSDYYSGILELGPLASHLLGTTYPLLPPSLDEMRDVMREAADAAGISFEPGLVERIVLDAQSPDALPLVSYLLRAMWDADPPGKLFTFALYEARGGLSGAVAQAAEERFQSLLENEREALLDSLVRELTQFDQQGRAIKRRARRSAFKPAAMPGIDSLISSRLLIGSVESGQATVEVAHEAVLRAWPRVASALERESATTRYVRQMLNEGSRLFAAHGVLMSPAQVVVVEDNYATLVLGSDDWDLILASTARSYPLLCRWLDRLGSAGGSIQSPITRLFDRQEPLVAYNCLSFLEGRGQPGLIDEEVIRSFTHAATGSLRRAAQRLLELQEEPTPYVRLPNTPIEDVRGSTSVAKYLVTNREYSVFVVDTGWRSPSHWEGGRFPGKDDHPVTHVSYFDALAYGEWLSRREDQIYRLPTESEWHVAAGWVSGNFFRRFPWGDQHDPNRCNTRESGYDDTTPIGLFEPEGDSRIGICDAAGNVWEWTSSLGREGFSALLEGLPLEELRWIPRVQKGGTFLADASYAVVDYRLVNLPELALQDFGFRLAREES